MAINIQGAQCERKEREGRGKRTREALTGRAQVEEVDAKRLEKREEKVREKKCNMLKSFFFFCI